jgi:CelD/BcsL family acetyltransferase involved in cellulose biosynthesis
VLMPRTPTGTVSDRSAAWPQVEAALAARPPDSVFRSAAWFRSCIETWGGRATWRVLELTSDQGRTAWSLLGARTELRHRVLPVRVLALGQAIDDALDQPWIEQNGFLGCEPEDFAAYMAQLLDRLSGEDDWDELRLGGMSECDAREAMRQADRVGLTVRLAIEQPTFEVDLDDIRSRHGGDYVAALSSNTRQQLRRSRRLAEQRLGGLTIERAANTGEALDWFDRTAPLHRARWNKEAGAASASGFDNPAFVEFHRRLIRYGFEAGAIEYLHIKAGDTTLAYLYNFVARNRVQFYLSGVDHQIDPLMRPGLLAHWAAIEQALAGGRLNYDFLAGDARYKSSLSTKTGRTLWLVLQRQRWRLRLEQAGRLAKHVLNGTQAPSGRPPAPPHA